MHVPWGHLGQCRLVLRSMLLRGLAEFRQLFLRDRQRVTLVVRDSSAR